MTPDHHRTVREMLGAFVLGHLSAAEDTAVRAHLDGCSDCRRDLAEIRSLAHDLSLVDLQRVSEVATPDPDLGRRIHDAVARERQDRDQRARRGHVLMAAAAVLAVLLVGGAGVAIGENIADAPVASAPVPIEPVDVTSRLAGAQASAGVVAHTWGIEIKLEAVGLPSGEQYAVMVMTGDGSRRSAGAFVGTGEQVMNCNLNTDVLRPDATGFEVLDEAGRSVLTADL